MIMKENIRVVSSIVVWTVLLAGFGLLGIYGFMRIDREVDSEDVAVGVELSRIKRVAPAAVGLDSCALQRIGGLVEGYVERGAIPGAVVAVVRGDKLAYMEAFGERCSGEPMGVDTRFDLASLTKPVVVATAVMQLVERGELRLSERVKSHIPDFEGWRDEEGRSHDITLFDLMTHTSKLPPYVSLERLGREYPDSTSIGREELVDYVVHCERELTPEGACRYSCLNYIALGVIIEQVTGMSLEEYARCNIFEPLAMEHTRYVPDGAYAALCAPTTEELCGIVHDPLAREVMAGVSGNAGLFSTAEDMAVYAAMMLGGGQWRGVRLLAPLSVDALFSVPRGLEPAGRTLGWKRAVDNFAAAVDLLVGDGVIVHTGATGTSMVIDRERGVAVVILANRTAGSATASDIFDLRSKVCNVVAAAIRE